MRISGTDWATESGSAMREKLFQKIDQDGDGKITKEELANGRPSAAEFAQRLFEKADADKDGKLTLEEMTAALPKEASSSALDTLFKEADEDGDGAISQTELESSLNRHISERAGTYTRRGDTTDPSGPRFTQVA